ncbi:MAG TPA: DNA repair protein RecN [Gemmatimonadaceae bacterium]|nr:DNA repair protein RecN [Gemmatimonadaceae bacterium]
MLTELRIKNFAIIETLALPLAPGFNVLSGETGAGKSIIVGAISLLLGERASADLVRTGADRATVEGVFDIADRPEIAAMLDARGIDVDEFRVVLKREVASNGRGRAWVNGTTVTAAVLADVGRSLVNLHGQHEADLLLDNDAQREILDTYAGAAELVTHVAAMHDALQSVRRERAELSSRRTEAERRADYLRHVVSEIDAVKLVAGEDTRLDEEVRRLTHADELKQLASGAASTLDGEVLSQLGSLQRTLASLRRIDPTLDRLQELYDTGYYAIEELARALEEYEEGVDLDPERLAEATRRRDLVFRLIKKYGPSLDDVIETGRTSRAELDLVDSAAFDLARLDRDEATAVAELSAAAGRLTAARREAAERLSEAVRKVLPDLGMSGGRFQVELLSRPEATATGAESVEFRVQLNVGHDMRSLARVASGGELSRVMLALKTILARSDRVPTLVFDEVDAGIGGRVGLQVGDTMRRVAEHHQVFAITHLPQIAARAHHHIVVSKGARGGVTTADITVLDTDTRVDEIARMLGGDPESDVSRAHARELLSSVKPAPSQTAKAKRR